MIHRVFHSIYKELAQRRRTLAEVAGHSPLPATRRSARASAMESRGARQGGLTAIMKQMFFRGCVLSLALVGAAVPSLGSDDANAILERFVAAQKKNGEQASQYTYVEQTVYFGFDKNGQPQKKSSETNDVIFLEGSTYKRLIARNERPLDPKEAAKEEKKMQQTAAERRQQRKSGIFHKEVTMGSDADLLTLFDSRLLGEEEVNGRKTWVVECSPKAGYKPANEREKEVLSFSRKLWIDELENVTLKSVHTVVGPHIVFMPGTTVTWEFEKINGDAWVMASMVLDGRLQIAKIVKPRARTEYKNSKFQKFDVQSSITTGEPK